MKKIFLYMILLLTVMASCKKEKDLNVDITKSNLDTYAKGSLDEWLGNTFLNPYNIEVLYRFDRYQADISKEIAPVMEDKVQPLMEGVEAVFIKPYLEMTSKGFLLPLLPKEIALFGSGEYSNDQVTLGTADAGRQINLYVVNSYDKADFESVMGTEERPAAFHTMHHEFVHILNQNIPVPPSFEDISGNYVGASWVGSANFTPVARNFGFITRYSRNNKNEDFAEMASTLLVEGQNHFEWYLNQATDATAVPKLRKKEQAVVDYYKSSFGIDFRVLQGKVRTAIETYAPVTKLSLTYWLNKGSFKGFTADRTALNQVPAFTTAYNTANTLVTAQVGAALRPTVELVFTDVVADRSKMILKFTAGNFSFWYDLTANIVVGDPGTLKLTIAATQGTSVAYNNGKAVQTNMKTILDYFTTKTFTINWIENIFPGSKNDRMGFFDSTTGQLAFYATIQK